MCEAFGTRVIEKHRAPEMRASSYLLNAVGIMSRETFMRQYTTVWARRIYPCFDIGQGDAEDRWGQLVVCVHEHQHVVQYDREGFAIYAAKYLANRRFRALAEAEAYLTQLELAYWRNDRVPNIDALADGLLAYGCRSSDVQAARSVLQHGADRLRHGERGLTRANRWALAWFDRHLAD